MDKDGRLFIRLIFLILLEHHLPLPVQLELSPLSSVHSTNNNDTTGGIENTTKTPLLTLKQFDSIEERFDLTTKQSKEAVLRTLPPRIDEKIISVANTSEAQLFELDKKESKNAGFPSTHPPREFGGAPAEVPIMVERSNVFTGIGEESWTLEEKIIEVEDIVCHSGCGSLSSVPYFPTVHTRCHSCHCDPTCIIYHTCCPDLVLRRQVTYSGLGSDCVELIATGVTESNIFKLNQQSEKLFSSMITKCHASTNGTIPANNHNVQSQAQQDMIKSKCEHPDISKPDELFPVTDSTTEIAYRNRHCSECNNANEDALKTWGSEIVCDGNLDLLLESKPNKTELYRMLTTKEEVERTGCHMVFLSGQVNFQRKCRYRLRPVIKTCNETGLWPQSEYHADIESACHIPSYSSLFMNKYKNMFCFLCNTDRNYDSEALAELARDSTQANTARLSFSALIDFGDVGHEDDVGESEKPTCQGAQFYDNLTCSCRDIGCSDGKEFITSENACRSLIESNVLGYWACARVEIQTYGATTLKDIDRLFRQFYIFNPSYRWKVTVSRWCPGSRDFTIHLEIREIQSHNFVPLEDIERNMEQIKISFCESVSHKMVFGQMKLCAIEYVEECPENKGDSFPCDIDNTVRIPQKEIVGQFHQDEGDMLAKTTFVTYLETNRCPFVEIPVADFNASEAMLIHFASGQKLPLSKVDYIKNATKIKLCLDDYVQWTQGNDSRCKEKRKDDDSFDTWTTAGLISIICSCISLLFLFLTFVTYILFDQLRSGGGKNIMVLTVTLFVAQALYEFAIEQYENEYLCSVFGIAIHFSWLASVFSMNACTWERFYKLCFPLKSRSFFMSGKAFIMATAYTFSCPLLIVICNISANISINGHVGYGNSRLCYINQRDSRIFSFVTPLCTIVAINTALLIFTICKLRRKSLPGERKTSQTRIGLVACVRLSVVTGATWLVSLLYEAVPVEGVGYIFTALLGLQGVVFFFSIVMNKKVLEMYRKLLSRFSNPHSSSGSGTNTTPLSKKSEEINNPKFHDVVARGNTSSTLSPGHTDLSRLSSGDSGFGGCEAEVKRE